MKQLALAFVILTGVGGFALAQTGQPIPTPPTAPKAGEYSTEAEAKKACGTDTVVWANTESKVLHPSSDPYYGKTKKGAYVCETAATKQGMHLAKKG